MFRLEFLSSLVLFSCAVLLVLLPRDIITPGTPSPSPSLAGPRTRGSPSPLLLHSPTTPLPWAPISALPQLPGGCAPRTKRQPLVRWPFPCVVTRDVWLCGRAALVGLSLSYALLLNASLSFLAWNASNLENKIVSVERCQQYSAIPPEAPLVIDSCRPPPAWPTRGTLQFCDLEVRLAYTGGPTDGCRDTDY